MVDGRGDGEHAKASSEIGSKNFAEPAGVDSVGPPPGRLAGKEQDVNQNENDRLPVPAGWRLVPVEPTKEMKRAAVIYANGPAIYKVISNAALEVEESSCAECYRAMLDAAPVAPAQPVQAQGEPVAYAVLNHVGRLVFASSSCDGCIDFRDAAYRYGQAQAKDWIVRRLFARPPRADAEIVPVGPREPDMSMVICPACTSQFRAISVDVQSEVARLRAALDKIEDESYDAPVREIARAALRGD